MTDHLSLSDRWRKAAKQSMEHDLGWDDLAESHDAGKASDAAVRVVLEHIRLDGGVWLTFEGAQRIDELLRVLDA